MKYDMKYAVTRMYRIALFFINVFIGSFIEIEENGWEEVFFCILLCISDGISHPFYVTKKNQ